MVLTGKLSSQEITLPSTATRRDLSEFFFFSGIELVKFQVGYPFQAT